MNFLSRFGAESMHLNMCRCCLGNACSKAASSDYYDNFQRKELYQIKLKDVFNIQFQSLREPTTDEQYFICEECISRLNDASIFKEMVVKNEATFVQYLRSQTGKDENQSNSELIEVKEEVLEATDFDMQHDEHDEIIDDDNEILANLKYEDHKAANSENTEQVNIAKKPKSKRCKKKVKDKTEERMRAKSQFRGPGPLLRENTIKLLANSTAAVFQWNKSRYRCFCCKEPFSDIDLLRTHTNSHALQEIQRNIINQQNRLVKVEITKLNCKLCQQQLENLDDLKEHLIQHDITVNEHLLVPFKIESELKCQICSKPYSLFRLLNIHMNKHFMKHMCEICGAAFSNLVFFNLHRTRSHRQIRCSNCDVIFLSRSEKKQHDIEVHGVKIERKYKYACPFCSERYSQECLKIKHMVEIHEMNKPEYCCQFCSKSYITRSLVNNHVKTVHRKGKTYECNECPKFFYRMSDLRRHKGSHSGEKSFTCSVCNNPFATNDSMKRHMKRTHVVH